MQQAQDSTFNAAAIFTDVTHAFRSLLPWDGACFYLVDDQGGTFAHYLVQLPTEQLKLYQNKLASHDPLSPARFNDSDRNVITLESAQHDFDSGLYVNAFLNAYELPHEVELFFRDSQDRIIAGMGLFRTARSGRFRVQDVDLLNRVHPLAECSFRFLDHKTRRKPCLRESYELTRREAEVVAHVQAGHSNRSVARLLGIKEATVKAHLFNAYEKIGVSSRTELLSRIHLLGH